jgi:hypothetical protein
VSGQRWNWRQQWSEDALSPAATDVTARRTFENRTVPDTVHGGRGLLRQAGQFLDGDALAADVCLPAEPVQHLLHQDVARFRL